MYHRCPVVAVILKCTSYGGKEPEVAYLLGSKVHCTQLNCVNMDCVNMCLCKHGLFITQSYLLQSGTRLEWLRCWKGMQDDWDAGKAREWWAVGFWRSAQLISWDIPQGMSFSSLEVTVGHEFKWAKDQIRNERQQKDRAVSVFLLWSERQQNVQEWKATEWGAKLAVSFTKSSSW